MFNSGIPILQKKTVSGNKRYAQLIYIRAILKPFRRSDSDYLLKK